ncbi:MAG: hypothetical protein BWY37_02126 [Firmicutes bacterium ADurb.Bin262]|nr:MAG: hypothetical protein BWY37_02126 [Firmicutes bacterium ADurb.Bin262]
MPVIGAAGITQGVFGGRAHQVRAAEGRSQVRGEAERDEPAFARRLVDADAVAARTQNGVDVARKRGVEGAVLRPQAYRADLRAVEGVEPAAGPPEHRGQGFRFTGFDAVETEPAEQVPERRGVRPPVTGRLLHRVVPADIQNDTPAFDPLRDGLVCPRGSGLHHFVAEDQHVGIRKVRGRPDKIEGLGLQRNAVPDERNRKPFDGLQGFFRGLFVVPRKGVGDAQRDARRARAQRNGFAGEPLQGREHVELLGLVFVGRGEETPVRPGQHFETLNLRLHELRGDGITV